MGKAGLEIVRGDNRTYTLAFTDSAGAVVDITGCTLFFTVKQKETPTDLGIGIVTMTIASPCVVTMVGGWSPGLHGLAEGRKIRFTTTEALPASLMEEEDYYVKYINTSTFNIALASGGTAINTTGVQSGTHTLWAIPTPASDTDADSLIQYTWTTHSAPTLGQSQFSLIPADTVNMSGSYPYDIQLKDTASKIFTPMYGLFKVVEDVTKRIT